MSPEDPRHGTYAGAAAHWKAGETPCPTCLPHARRRRKLNRYLRLTGAPATVPALGTVRRIQALRALGWHVSDIARASGVPEKTLRNPSHRGTSVYRSTAEAVADVYERLCMTRPNGGYHERQRRYAVRMGWAPPLAWDDIDHDPHPCGTTHATDVDPTVVERILSGDWRLPATPAERLEVIERWTGSRNELARLTGWNIARDLRRAA